MELTPYLSNDDDLDDYEASEFESQDEDDRDDLKRCSQSLGISRDYVRSWSCQDAFREFYQNW